GELSQPAGRSTLDRLLPQPDDAAPGRGADDAAVGRALRVLMARRLLVAALLLMATLASAQTAAPSDRDPRIEKLVGSISQERLDQLLHMLVSFGTRNTLSDASSP